MNTKQNKLSVFKYNMTVTLLCIKSHIILTIIVKHYVLKQGDNISYNETD